MNPSNFPQVIRSRSRSPSPSVSRRRLPSDVDLSSLCAGPDRLEGECQNRENLSFQDSKNLLSVRPKERDWKKVRGAGAGNLDSVPQRTSMPRGGVAELENMANVDLTDTRVVVSDHSDRTDHTAYNNPDPDSDPDPGLDLHYDPHFDPSSHQDVVGCHSHRHSHHHHHHQHHDHHPRSRASFRSISADPCDERGLGESASGHTRDYGTSGEGCGSWTPDQVDGLRHRVKFFFLDPCSKFRVRKQLPMKLCLQIIKIIVITVQLVQFGAQRSDIVEYFEQNQRTLQHILLKNWEPGYETMPYPPATGDYALYSVKDLLDYIDHAWTQYYSLKDTSLATVNLIHEPGDDQPVPIRLCNRFNNYDDFHNGSYVVGKGVLRNCTDLVPMNASESKTPYDIRRFMELHNITIPFHKLLDLTLQFSFTTFHLNLLQNHYGPTCYYVNATILYKNHERSGQVLIELLTTRTERVCSGKIMTPAALDEERSLLMKSVALDAGVILVCILSSTLCVRSLYRATRLRQKTEQLFRQRFGKKLCMSDRMEFVNFWYILIIINDIFTVVGSAYKIRLETRTVTITSHNYDFCSVLLGLGGLMAWVGCLRYLGFFKKYNILILTLKTAFPNMLRFMVCTLAIYLGFMFCGWVILGPYHIKFRHLSTTSECLYSLVNGDDMFVTFSATQTNNVVLWYFSRVYLYVFISLFIYCVLSLFISVIMDTYENLKEFYIHGFPKTGLQEFLEESDEPLTLATLRRRVDSNNATGCSLFNCLAACCCRGPNGKTAEERTPLLVQTI